MSPEGSMNDVSDGPRSRCDEIGKDEVDTRTMARAIMPPQTHQQQQGTHWGRLSTTYLPILMHDVVSVMDGRREGSRMLWS
jgi:hypothetical protein